MSKEEKLEKLKAMKQVYELNLEHLARNYTQNERIINKFLELLHKTIQEIKSLEEE